MNNTYYNNFEQLLQILLLERCAEGDKHGRQLLEAPEIDEEWDRIAPEYLVDAVPEIADYPMVSLAWAAYVGMALAHFWDKDWTNHVGDRELYKKLKKRGFDCMDEYIVQEILAIPENSEDEKLLTSLMQSLAELTLTAIRKEHVEPQSKAAFHIYARSVKVLCRIGASLELWRLGYRYHLS